MISFKNLKAGFLVACLIIFGATILFPQAGSAAWWKFGRNENIPEIENLKFNSINAEDVEQVLHLAVDDLVSGRIIIRGRADIGKGVIGKVEISLDNGHTWRKAILGDRGMFTFEFVPEKEKEYGFAVKALSTTGKSNDVEDSSFKFMVSSRLNTDAVKAVFIEILKQYMAENHSGFMTLVSDDFEGDRSALYDAITDDFRFFDNIRIEPHITRIIGFDNNFEVYFTFNRQVQSSRTGQLLRDAAATSVTFGRGGKSFQIVELAQPLIFGVSNPAEVATDFTEESEGTLILVVDKNGEAGLDEATEDSEDSDIEEGEVTLNSTPGNPEGFNFADAQKNDCQAPDCANNDLFVDQDFLMCVDASIQELPGEVFDDVTQVPDQVYPGWEVQNPQLNVVYAINLNDGSFAIIIFTQYQVNGQNTTATFRYKYNPEGNTF